MRFPRRQLWIRQAMRPLLGLALLLPACALTNSAVIQLPSRNSIESDQLIIQSDFRIPSVSPVVSDLKLLRTQVIETLELPASARPVTVYLFSNEEEYSKYLKKTYPDLPERRAYFVKKNPGQELAVYTAWSDRIQEDLRHEFTHGLLHAALNTPPLWIDEGLAEYFEVAGVQPGGVNLSDYGRLLQSLKEGWSPDMNRLERLTQVDQMNRADYREAWAWVHFLLHSSPDSRQIVLEYLQELRTNRNPRPLSERVYQEIPDANLRLKAYLGSLSTNVVTAK